MATDFPLLLRIEDDSHKLTINDCLINFFLFVGDPNKSRSSGQRPEFFNLIIHSFLSLSLIFDI